MSARFHLPPSCWDSEPALVGDEARHLAQVLRARPGERVTVFDGVGRQASAEVLAVSRDRVPLRLGEVSITLGPHPAITLAQAIPKGKTMDLIVQKAVELGVTRIQPLVTRNTVVQPGDGKAEKWRRGALEACKQCGLNILPEVADPLPFETWLHESPQTDGLKIIASLATGARSFREILQRFPATTAVTVLIGPEGDFTADETAAALAAGFLPISLGSAILRVETATIFALAGLRYEFGA